MALVFKDRVQETSSTTGTGTLTLGGAVSGYQTFSSAIGNTNTTYYAIVNDSEWEVGLGTVSAGQLSRDTVLESSNANTLVNFSAGTKYVFCTYAADKTVIQDESNKVSGYAIENSTIGATTASTGKFTSVTTPSVTATTTDLTLSAISTGAVKFSTLGGLQAQVSNVASAVNYLQFTGSPTTKAVEFDALGTDTNISMAFQPKGTGAIDLVAGSSGVNISNGGTVTAITKTANGTAYTSFPSIAISAPTTAGGVQAVGTISTMILNNFPTAVANGGTGYTVGNVLTIVGGTPSSVAGTLTVTSVSGGVITGVGSSNFATYTALPANPVSVTGGSGTGATITATWVVGTIVVSTAGSGYIEQPTITFSGGGGSGAAAYASVGGNTVVRSLGTNLDFYTPSSINGSVPAFRLADGPATATVDSYLTARPSNGYTLMYAQGNTNASIGIYSNGTGSITFGSNSTAQIAQMRVAYTASAVNFVQVTGSATGGRPQISAQGSDASINMDIIGKGSSRIFMLNANARSAEFTYGSATTLASNNWVKMLGNAGGSAPVYGVEGTDTNIDI
jgi:hypothetical protein